MPSWSKEQYEAHQARVAASSAKPEQVVRHEPVAKEEGKAGYPNRVRVCVVSFRRRLCDPDNLCPKYFVDCLRYAEIIPNDREEDIELTVRQVKVKTKEEERTEIEVTTT